MTGGDPVLWNVVEEHFDEAEFLLDQWRGALGSPRLTLALVQKTMERRLVAHLDGLVVGGMAVADKVLWPALDNETEAPPTRVAAATLALLLALDGAITQRVIDLFTTTDSDALLAGLRLGFQLTSRTDVDEPLRLALYAVDAPAAQIALLDVLAARRVDPGPILGALLQSPNNDVVRAALGAAPASDPRMYQYTIESLLAHDVPGTRSAAMRTALIWNMSSGWRTCLAEARAGAAPAMPFLALLGGTGELGLLADALRSAEQRGAALFALGFYGRRDAVDACLPFLDDPDEKVAKLAVEAIAAITDLPLFDKPFAQSPAEDAGADELPPLEEDLAADLMPKQVDEIPLPDAKAVRAWWSERRASFDANQRYLRGKVLSAAAIQDALTLGPLWRSGPFLDEIGVRSGGRVQLPAFRIDGGTPVLPPDVSLHRHPAWR
ncbi:MAG: hypothetical protein ABJA82_04635 [Myxococcales bacterium]